jgi:hypothetical protein
MNTVYTFTLVFFLTLLLATGCEDFLDIGTPRTELLRSSVFSEVTTANAAVVELYNSMRQGFVSGYPSGLSITASLSSDELLLFEPYADRIDVSENEIMPDNKHVTELWGNMYHLIYKANAIIEGLSESDIEQIEKDRLTGEALFVRAFTYFHLVNLWGDVPLVLSTDYQVNNRLTRAPVVQVNEQIVSDLLKAQLLLQEEYDGERVRANRGAATALLARMYLYLGQWSKAEEEATKVINNELYALEDDLTHVFQKSSPEAILQLWSSIYPLEYIGFLFHEAVGGPLYVALRPEFLGDLSPDDYRYTNWVKTMEVSGVTFYGVDKYKNSAVPPAEYSTVLRLAELYLTRAEARTHQDKLSEASEDLNVIRERAGLTPEFPANKEELLEAIYLERKHEFFGELGHRWFDLKRTGRADAVLSPLKSLWDKEDVLFPIPEIQIVSNPDITQNPLGS